MSELPKIYLLRIDDGGFHVFRKGCIMLSMNGIIVLELILGVVMMILVFTTLGNTELIADSSSKGKHEPEPDGVWATMKSGRTRIEVSCLMYMSILAGDYYWAKATGSLA